MIVSSLLALFALVFIVYQLYRSDVWGPLSKIQGPFLARFTRLWEQSAVLRGSFASTNKALHRKYGPVVRLGPGKYSFDDPDAAKIIYAHSSKFTKTDFYKVFRPGDVNIHDIFTEMDNQAHRENKRKTANVYSMSVMRTLEHHVDSVSVAFLERMKGFAASKEVIHPPHWLQYYAFDVIGKISFNKSFNFVREGWDHNGILHEIDTANRNPTYVSMIPEWYMPLGRISQFFGWALDPEALKTVLSWTGKAVAEKKLAKPDPTGERSDMFERMSALLDAGKLSQQQMMNALLGNVAAGSDTTGVSLSSIVWNLAANPAVKAKLQEELRTFEAAGKISNPVTFSESQAMPYLQAVIKESLRVNPAVGLVLPRRVPKGGVELAGHFFPEGTTVGVNPWVMNFNKKWWGEDADEFKPERWLVSHEEAGRLDTGIYTFGAGSRVCLGKNIALMEMSKLIPQLYRTLDFELAGPVPDRKFDQQWFVYPDFTMRVKTLA